MDGYRHWHREVLLLLGLAEQLLKLVAPQPQQAELGRIALTDVLDQVQPEVLRVGQGLLVLPRFEPQIVTAGRGPSRFNLDDAVAADQVGDGFFLVARVPSRPSLPGLLLDDEGDGGVLDRLGTADRLGRGLAELHGSLLGQVAAGPGHAG
jgi:hypothetical protein